MHPAVLPFTTHFLLSALHDFILKSAESLAGHKELLSKQTKKKKKSFNFFFPGVVAYQKNTLLTWL